MVPLASPGWAAKLHELATGATRDRDSEPSNRHARIGRAVACYDGRTIHAPFRLCPQSPRRPQLAGQVPVLGDGG